MSRFESNRESTKASNSGDNQNKTESYKIINPYKRPPAILKHDTSNILSNPYKKIIVYKESCI